MSSDSAGKITTVTNSFTVDATPPVIALVSPAVNPATNTFGVTSPVLTIPVTDVNPDPAKTTATLDGVPVTVGTILGPFTVGAPHTLVISTTDLAGNITTTTMNLLFADGAMTSLGATAPAVGDALLALRVAVSLDTTVLPTSDTFKHGDAALLVNGVPAPD